MNDKQKNQYIRTLMATHAREILNETGTIGLIKGEEENVNEVISALIDAYPEAKKNRPENPGYSFTDLLDDFSTSVPGAIIQTGFRQTRGYFANNYNG